MFLNQNQDDEHDLFLENFWKTDSWNGAAI